MKLCLVQGLLVCVLSMSAMALHAQGVYVVQGEKGPVFSDKPQPGAKPVTLRPLSVVPSVKESVPVQSSGAGGVPDAIPAKGSQKMMGQEGGEGGTLAYSRLTILMPADGSAVIGNTGTFEVRLVVEPQLLLGDGHAFVVRINGRTIAQRFTATEFLIPPESWGDVSQPFNQPAQLDVSIVDSGGQVVKRAAPVRFTLRYATVPNPIQPMIPMPLMQPPAHVHKPTVSARPAPEPRPVTGWIPGRAEGKIRQPQSTER